MKTQQRLGSLISTGYSRPDELCGDSAVVLQEEAWRDSITVLETAWSLPHRGHTLKAEFLKRAVSRRRVSLTQCLQQATQKLILRSLTHSDPLANTSSFCKGPPGLSWFPPTEIMSICPLGSFVVVHLFISSYFFLPSSSPPQCPPASTLPVLPPPPAAARV